MRKKAFFRNLPTIAAMGIVGTYIGFAFIAGLLAAFAKLIPGITLAVRRARCSPLQSSGAAGRSCPPL